MREVRLLHKQGSIVWVQLHISPVPGRDGHTYRMLVQAVDITAGKEAQDRFAHAAHHDALTGLPNRCLFDIRLHEAAERVHQHDGLLSVLFLDLDGFKAVNDTCGHELGDRLLQAMAGRLRGCIRSEDTVARLGGDEFLILLSRLTEEHEAAQIAEALLTALGEVFVIERQAIHLAASIGISLFPATASDPAALVRCADQAMYRVKMQGKNGYAVYSIPSATSGQDEARA